MLRNRWPEWIGMAGRNGPEWVAGINRNQWPECVGIRNLRSAIKYFLEELGYEVLLSEYNDFPKPLDQNAYKACLSTVERADYYILLIGSRVGGYYDAPNKVSITRMEYRKAYELATSERTRLIVFVRDELWKIKADRVALASFLEAEFASSKEIQSEDRRRIASHPSPHLNDAEALFNFIDEVSRASEMKAAVEGQAPFPSANWVHTFTTFGDLVDVLRTHLGISDGLSKVALKVNLQRELLENLTVLTEKHKGRIDPIYRWASFARQHITGGMDDRSRMPGRYLRWALMYSVVAIRGSHLSTQFLDHALASGQFLQYDKDAGSYQPTLLSERLFQLRNRIDSLRTMTQDVRQLLIDFTSRYKDLAKTEDDVSVPNQDLVGPLAFADTQQDIVDLSVAIQRALEGDATCLPAIRLNPPSPLAPEAERIEQETVTLDDVKAWIAGLRLTT